jgi:hypothetical protein
LRRALWGAATAATVVLAFLGGHYFWPAPAKASAEAIVRDAQRTHDLPLDRCYLVQSVPEPGSVLTRYPRLAQRRESRLWTRGDRFWVAPADDRQRWAWGQDEKGRVWLARKPQRGVRYEPAEVPPALAVARDVFSMRVSTLLDEVLHRFALKRERGEGSGPTATTTVRAELRPGQTARGLSGALLEIDSETRAVRRLVLHRTTPRGEPLATVTFTLIENAPQPDAVYQLEGHLSDEAEIIPGVNQGTQRPFLRQFFGLPAKNAAP